MQLGRFGDATVRPADLVQNGTQGHHQTQRQDAESIRGVLSRLLLGVCASLPFYIRASLCRHWCNPSLQIPANFPVEGVAVCGFDHIASHRQVWKQRRSCF